MKNPILNDPYLKVVRLAFTPNPQQVVWAGMHQDYSEKFVAHEKIPDETKAGEVCVIRLLKGDRGHYGPLEHPQITFNVGWFPHGVMQQARTHRVGVSFDVQSMRYTGQRIVDYTQGKLTFDEVFYLRPVGFYSDRQGKKYEYTNEDREKDSLIVNAAAHRYAIHMDKGFAEEHSRGILQFDYRQHFVVSFSLRAALHFMDLRSKLDAQPEIQALCELMWPHIKTWAPEIATWYESSRLGKARLAP